MILGGALITGGCAATGNQAYAARGAAGPQEAVELQELESFQLPSGWQRASPARFEALLSDWIPDARPPAAQPPVIGETEGEEGATQASVAPLPAPQVYGDLEVALAPGDSTSMRAALLAHSLLHTLGDVRAQELLLARLEARQASLQRALDAADVVCAAALFGVALEHGYGERLAALATGPQAHPDLEVRIECARSALAAGRDEVVPFLLRVLRAGTQAEREDPIDWPSKQTMAWAKTRASTCLAERAGVLNDFRPDASYADQITAAERLARLLSAER